MAIEVQTFVLGTDPYPEWFKQLDKDKKVNYVFQEDGELNSVIIKNPTKYTSAKVGETLIFMQGMVIVADTAKVSKYMRKPNGTKEKA